MAGSDPVTLSCQSHHEELVNGLWRHFLSGQLADYHVHMSGRSIRVHHLILQIFLSPHKLALHALSPPHLDSLDGLLEFVYRGTVTVDRSRLDSLQELADQLEFPILAHAVQQARTGNTLPVEDVQLTVPVDSTRRQRKSKPIKRTSSVKLTDKAVPETRQRITRSSKTKDGCTSQQPTNEYHPMNDTLASSEDNDHLADPNDTNQSEVLGDNRKPRKPTEEDSTQFKCEHCSYKTSVAIRLQNHLARRHDPTMPHLICDVCNKTFRSEALLANHAQIHADRPATYTCPNCPYVTTAVKNYYHHLRSVHEVNARGEPSPKRFRCVDCPYTCIYPNKLRLHREAVHSNLKNYGCSQCDYRTGVKTSLRRHIQVAHLKIRPHLCHTCGFSTVSQSHLAKHLRMHTGAKPHVCGLCDARYASADAYKMHVRRHLVGNEKPFVCDVCGYSCNRKDNLRVHLRKVHDRPAL